MQLRGGYHEEKWDAPTQDGFHDSLYVFAYDWRLDNVENARLLVHRVEALKAKLNRPDLKFDIVAHSMGGLIARYAAMYGDADLVRAGARPDPTWAGAKDFGRIILLGTPNHGAALSLSTLLNGFTVGGVRIDLPFVEDSSKFTMFTLPSAYQLLPAPDTIRAFDDRSRPVAVDIYDPKVWDKYGWNVTADPEFVSEFDAADRRVAQEYFRNALSRGKRFHEALGAAPGKSGGISFFMIGADCGTAVDGVVIYRDELAGKWKTTFRPRGFTRADGSKITDSDMKKLVIGRGDGIVSQRSFQAVSGVKSDLVTESSEFICEDHNKLAANMQIQDHVIRILKANASVDKTEKIAVKEK
jgi:pimeloyl-ACP methyl ester carboxylesterase